MWDALIISPFVNVLLFIYTLVQNFGLAIILFTILIRLITHPLMASQMKGTQKMQELQSDPRYIEMQKKYKDDKEKLAAEQMKLYKELGVSPFSSCLPTLIQFPLIIGLYQSVTRALASTPMEMLFLERHIYSGFLNVSNLLPINRTFLWMDLSQPERLIIPGLSFGIPILAIVVVLTTYLQSKLMTPMATSSGDSSNQTAAQMGKAMNLYMPFLMGWMALTLASGLSLYFLTSNVIGIVQYAALGKVNWRNVIPGLSSSSNTKITKSTTAANPIKTPKPASKKKS